MNSATEHQHHRRKCCFRNCSVKSGFLEVSDSKVEVKTALPSEQTFKNLKDKFVISWQKSGDAAFHRQCWVTVLEAARARKYRKPLPKLLFEEKVLVKEAAKTAEYHDSFDQIQTQAVHAAKLLKTVNHCVAFTGAGISTSAGIGDFRGKSGKWTEDSHNALDMDSLFEIPNTVTGSESVAHDDLVDQDDDSADNDGVPYEDLRPTYTHEALCKLLQLGYLKYIISQNADGLHSLSGIPKGKISELHGNVYQEKCEKCGTRYDRTEYVLDDLSSQYFEELDDNGSSAVTKPSYAKQCPLCGLGHRTGRKCAEKGCSGYLCDTIINFRDNLEDDVFESAQHHATQCDLMLSLGSTMTVTPASDLVDMIQSPNRLVICNRQKTSMDKVCFRKDSTGQCLGARAFGDCDTFMKEFMRNILSQEELQSWESSRPAQMKEYDRSRQKSQTKK